MKKLRHFHPMYRCGYPNMSPSSCAVCTTVYKCLHGLAPKYLADLCVPVAEVCRAASTPLCQLRTSGRPSFQHVKLRPTCVFVCRPSH